MAAATWAQECVDGINRRGGAAAVVAELREAIEHLYREKRNAFLATAVKGGGKGAAGLEAKEAAAAAGSYEFSEPVAISSTWMPASASLPSLPPVASPLHPLILESFSSSTVSFLDGLLLRYMLARRFDAASAAQRFLVLRRAVLKYKLSFVLTDDIRAVLAQNTFTCFPPLIEPVGTRERPVIIIHPRLMTWKNVTVEQMQRTVFFAALSAIFHTFTAQTVGVVVQDSSKGVSLSNMNHALTKFATKALTHSLPCRLSATFLANEPFMFASVGFPLMRSSLNEKVQARVRVLGTKYAALREELTEELIDEDMDGKAAVTSAAYGERQLAVAEAQHQACFGAL